MIVAGVDEVGRGPLAGPVVSAAVVLPERYELAGLADSKRLSTRRREQLSAAIKEQAVCYAFGQASQREIDQLNILYATLLAMRRAVLALSTRPDRVEVDGNRIPDLPMPATAIVKGDSRVAAISAASILAKVYRDRLMQQLGAEFPQYGWQQNAGYPTAQHLQALQEFGVTPHHRRSFAPVAKLL